MKKILLSGLTLIVLIFLFKISFATDSPHTAADDVSCYKCHTLHNAPGTSLTNAENENLCLSCHTSGGFAALMPFSAQTGTNVTIPGTYGRNHSWIGTMPVSSNPANSFGLRAADDLYNEDLKARLAISGGVVYCSICHNPHNQQKAPWDPDSRFPYSESTSTGRHYMRAEFYCVSQLQDTKSRNCSPNEPYINDLCQDCHYYRAMTYARAKGEDSSYPANGTNVFSHSVGDKFNFRGYDHEDPEAPLDFDGGPHQNAPRYSGNSTSEPSTTPGANKTNNLVFDQETRVRCLTCHKMHNVDSNGVTVDGF